MHKNLQSLIIVWYFSISCTVSYRPWFPYQPLQKDWKTASWVLLFAFALLCCAGEGVELWVGDQTARSGLSTEESCCCPAGEGHDGADAGFSGEGFRTTDFQMLFRSPCHCGWTHLKVLCLVKVDKWSFVTGYTWLILIFFPTETKNIWKHRRENTISSIYARWVMMCPSFFLSFQL